MSFYRIYHYRSRNKAYRHIYFNRNRGTSENTTSEDIASENAAAIIKELNNGEKSYENLSRARRTIKDYILCNPFDYFCTFTFKDSAVDRYDFKACKNKIAKVFDNYKNHYSPIFRYIIVPEFHKDGGVHFHGMVLGIRPQDLTIPEMIYKRNKMTDKLQLVPNTKKYVDWTYYSSKLGFYSCSRIKNYDKCAVYVSKYITKDLIKLNLGQRVFMASQNLQKPELIFDEDNIPMTLKPDFQNDFVSVTDNNSTLGLLPDWWQEKGGCSELLEDEPQDAPLIESEIFFPRLTGKQLAF